MKKIIMRDPLKSETVKFRPAGIILMLLLVARCGVPDSLPPARGDAPTPEGGWYAQRPWPINFHPSESIDRRRAVCEAAATWNGLADRPFFICSPSATRAPVAPSSPAQQLANEADSLNSVAFSSTWAHTGKDSDIPAFTTLVSVNGVLIEADIYFNDLYYLWAEGPRGEDRRAGVWDVGTVALHELGHWLLGPGHVPLAIDPESVMRSHSKEEAVHAVPSRGDGERLRARLASEDR